MYPKMLLKYSLMLTVTQNADIMQLKNCVKCQVGGTMERENFVDSRKYAIKGTLVFTAQREQFTIMEDAYLVCDGKKLQGLFSVTRAISSN